MKIICIFSFLILIFFNFSSSKNIKYFQNQFLKATDDCKDKSFLPTENNVKITGRFYQNEDITWLVQSGSSIEFYLTGIKTEIILVGDKSIYQDENHRPRYAIYLDDKLYIDNFVKELEFDVVLFKEEEFREKTVKVKIMLLSENTNGGVGIKNINTYICSNQRAIEPVEEKKINIEFIGDSITCAYGVDAKNQYENFKTKTENFSKSYAYLASKILDADYSTICYSGSGIVSGYSGGEKNANNLLPPFYEQISRNTNYKGDWDFNLHKNDIVFINLGTNDNNYVKGNPSIRNDEFIQEYINFLSLVRLKNPDAYIICTLGTLGCDEIYSLVEQAIRLFGDSRISCFLSPQQDMNDGLGADWHPSAVTHEKLSKLVVEKISEVLS